MDQEENSLDLTTINVDHIVMITENNQPTLHDKPTNNNDAGGSTQNTPTKKKRQYTALNGDYWRPSDAGKRRRHSTSTPPLQQRPNQQPVQKKPQNVETPRPAFTLRRKEWVPKYEKQITHIVEESANTSAKENPDVTTYQNLFVETELQRKMEEVQDVVSIHHIAVSHEKPRDIKTENLPTKNDVKNAENPTTPSLRKRKDKKQKDASSSKSSSSKKKKYDKSLRLDLALEQPNMQGWSEARIRAYAMRDKEPNAYYYRFNDIGESQKSGAWTKEEQKLFFKRMEELGGVDYRWGIFSMAIPGRVGYQCANFYRKLIASGEIKDENYKYDAAAKKFRYVGKADKEGSSSGIPTKKKHRGRKRKPREDDDEESSSNSEADNMNSESESDMDERMLLAKAESLLHSNKENSNSLNTSVRSDNNTSDTSVTTPGSEKSPRKLKQMDLGSFFGESSPEKKVKKDTLKVPKKTKRKSPKKIAEQQKRKEEKKLAAALLKEQQLQQEQLRQFQLEFKLENEGKGKEICPRLFLGSRKVAQNLKWLTENNVKFILNVTREVKNYFQDQEFQYKRIRITDAAFEDLASHFHDTFEFIRKAIEDSHGVLVHCSEGRSRSVTVIIAFLMQYHKWTLDQCYRFMCEKSDNLNINDGFKMQLMDLEQKIFNASSVNFFDKGGRKAKLSPRSSMNGMPATSSPRPSSPRLNKSTDNISPSHSLNNSANLDVSDILNTSDTSVEATSRNIPSPVLMPPPSSNVTETVSFSTNTSDNNRNFTVKITDNVFTTDGKLEAQIITMETLSVATPNDSEDAENESEDSEASSQSQSQSQSQLSDTSIIPLQPSLKDSNSFLLADLPMDLVTEPTEAGVQFIPQPSSTNASLTAAWDNDSASVGFDEDLLNNWLGMQ